MTAAPLQVQLPTRPSPRPGGPPAESQGRLGPVLSVTFHPSVSPPTEDIVVLRLDPNLSF